jgi:hypothetical protein
MLESQHPNTTLVEKTCFRKEFLGALQAQPEKLTQSIGLEFKKSLRRTHQQESCSEENVLERGIV